jgi:hypothetical protein
MGGSTDGFGSFPRFEGVPGDEMDEVIEELAEVRAEEARGGFDTGEYLGVEAAQDEFYGEGGQDA